MPVVCVGAIRCRRNTNSYNTTCLELIFLEWGLCFLGNKGPRLLDNRAIIRKVLVKSFVEGWLL